VVAGRCDAMTGPSNATVEWNSRFRQIELPHQPAHRGVVRSSAPYQNRSNMELIGSRWSMA
jgi:hypothetical protein